MLARRLLGCPRSIAHGGDDCIEAEERASDAAIDLGAHERHDLDNLAHERLEGRAAAHRAAAADGAERGGERRLEGK